MLYPKLLNELTGCNPFRLTTEESDVSPDAPVEVIVIISVPFLDGDIWFDAMASGSPD